MDRFRAALDQLVEKVKETIGGEPKNPVEILLDQHLSLDEELVSFSPKNCMAVAIPTVVMSDFAARTRNVVDYPFIMERIWEILIDHQHDPTLMKKALNLLLYVLINGSIQVLKDCQDSVRMSFLQNLTEDYNRYEFEQYKFSQHLDVGAGVRKIAAEILHLITNERELFHARREAEKLHQKLSDRGLRTMSSSSLQPQGISTPNVDVRPPPYTDCYGLAPASGVLNLRIVTHPDYLFDEPLVDTVGIRPASPAATLHDNIHQDVDVGASSNNQPTSKRGRNRKDDTRSSQEGDNKGVSISNHSTESVDLLGLEALGLECFSPVSLRSKPPPSVPIRAQSAQFRASGHFTATI